MTTYSNHMVKHNPSISGNLQCDMCKLYFRDQRKMYKHMNMYHLNKFSCMCMLLQSISGNLQCDMCKLYFRDQRKMYKHMNMYHLNKFSCMCM
ncbi:hypothetical protein OBRU01_08809, partial [Operophtera brumata]